MGRIIRFWPRRRLKGLDELDPRQRIRFWPEERRRKPLGKAAFVARPFALAAILGAVAVGFEPALVEPPALLSSEPEQVDETFTRCGRGRGHACVIDGDTFKLGDRKVRIIGIDAPEVQAQCAEEAALAEAATAKLQELLSQGPFEMVAPTYGDRDRYGRELRVVRRTLADGSVQSIASEMRTSGAARRYMGFKTSWC